MKKFIYAIMVIMVSVLVLIAPTVCLAGRSGRHAQIKYNSTRSRVQDQINAGPTIHHAQRTVRTHASTLKRTPAQQRTRVRAIHQPVQQAKPGALSEKKIQSAKKVEQKIQQEDDDQDVGMSSRDLKGAVIALGLILLYEFVVAPKMGTKQLGIKQFCQALINRQNPFTYTPTDTRTSTDDGVNRQDGPGFFKRLGFNVLLAFLGL